MVLKFTSKRPDEELDGLQPLEEHFKSAQHEDVIAVVVVSGHTVVEDLNDGARTATVRIKQIETVTGEDEKVVRSLIAERYAKRTGNATLPIEEPADPSEASELPQIPWGGETE